MYTGGEKFCGVFLFLCNILAKMTRRPNAGIMLVQRQRQWANISQALGQRVMFAGIAAMINRMIILARRIYLYPSWI